MPGRKFKEANSSYRFGFGGQEHSSEFNDNSYTAEFWQYDARLGRRWNIDPRPNLSLSPYSVLGNNPMINIDPLGDTLLNKADQRIANKLEKKINNTNKELSKTATDLTTKIGKAEAKGDNTKANDLRAELEDVNLRISANNTSLSRLKAIKDDQNWAYTFKQLPTNSTEGGTKLGIESDPNGEQQAAVVMSILGDGNAIHEITHAYQGQIKKSIDLTLEGGRYVGKTLFARQMRNADSEVEAYIAQYAFDPSSMPISMAGGQPKAMRSINAFYVGGLNDDKKPPQPIYENVRNMVYSILASPIFNF